VAAEQGFIDDLLWGRDRSATALVYADWLEENGQLDRARFIRAQMEYGEPGNEEVRQRWTECRDRCTAALPVSASLRKKVEFYWDCGLLIVCVEDSADVSEADLDDLAAIPFLTTLTNIHNLSPERLAQLASCPNVRCLMHGTIGTLSDEQLRAISEVPAIIDLVLCGHGVNDDYLTYLPAMTQLQHLALTESEITDAGLARLGGLVRLTRLVLSECSQIGNAGLKSLVGLRHLEDLSLANTKINNAGLKHLANFEELRYLDVSNTQITGAGLATICRLKKLVSLKLSGNEKIDDTHILKLAQLPELTDLDIGFTSVTRFRLPRLLAVMKLKHLRTNASLGVRGDSSEEKEVQAFLDTCKEHDVLVDMDYE
jgi:uncharacterized protein (TIGR02996 family)